MRVQTFSGCQNQKNMNLLLVPTQKSSCPYPQ